ncbi:hypothetical protein M9Y10_019664 [Tritrichomonas musculus]|uniref:Protein kinase domain-containing protein n=1 Tax=Tritrichomonas musculus TaxID=1915356 RepID=A0ABR2HHV3_9EUKA
MSSSNTFIESYKLNLNEFDKKKFRRGANYNIYELIDKKTGKQYAARHIDFGRDNKKFFYRELEIMVNYSIPSPFIVQFIGYCIHTRKSSKKKETGYLIYDKCYLNPLSTIFELNESKLKEIGWNDTKKFIVIYGIASGMSHLHSKNIRHRDLKPENIFLDDYLFPKIGNFETAVEMDAIRVSTTFQQSTAKYMAPEFIENYAEYNRTPEIDVYSFGMTMYEIINNRMSYPKWNVAQIIGGVIEGKRPEFDETFPGCYRKLIKKCWSQKPEDRPTFEEIINELNTNPEFKENIDKEEFNNYIEYIKDPENYSGKIIKIEIEEEEKTEIEEEEKTEIETKKKHLSIDLPQIDLSRFEKIKNIGEGSFAKVYKVFEKITGNIYACKISRFEADYMDEDYIKNTEREITVMSKIKFCSVVEFIGFNPKNFKDQERATIITEFIPNYSLDVILDLERKGQSIVEWDDTHKLITIYGIARGMSYLHSLNILHRDLKPGNIFLDEYLFPKIGDFGLSKIIQDESFIESMDQRSCMKGTPAYISPEIHFEKLYSKSGDVYAFGMIVYEIITGEKTFEGLNLNQIIINIKRGHRPSFKHPIPKCYQELIENCWNQNPQERPTFDEIVDVMKNNPEFIIGKVDEHLFKEYIEYIKRTIRNTSEEEGKFQKVSIDLAQTEEEDYDEKFFADFVDLDDYEKVELIKKGQMYSEHEVRKKKTGQLYLAKISNIKINKLSRDELIRLSREANIMMQIIHPSIVKFLGYSPTDFSNKRRPVLITELTKKGTLSQVLKEHRKLDSTSRLIIMYGISSGMSYLHSHKILHRNLNPDSIYVDEYLYPKIGNFELSSRIHTLESMTFQSISGLKGRPSYSSPEILQRNQYSESGDVYSFGMLVYELITGEIPFKGNDSINYIMDEVIMKSKRPEINDEVEECYRELIEICWSQEPSDRPTFSEITSILKNDERFIKDDVDKDKYHIYVKYIEESNIEFYSNIRAVELEELIKSKKQTNGNTNETLQTSNKTDSNSDPETKESTSKNFEMKIKTNAESEKAGLNEDKPEIEKYEETKNNTIEISKADGNEYFEDEGEDNKNIFECNENLKEHNLNDTDNIKYLIEKEENMEEPLLKEDMQLIGQEDNNEKTKNNSINNNNPMKNKEKDNKNIDNIENNELFDNKEYNENIEDKEGEIRSIQKKDSQEEIFEELYLHNPKEFEERQLNEKEIKYDNNEKEKSLNEKEHIKDNIEHLSEQSPDEDKQFINPKEEDEIREDNKIKANSDNEKGINKNKENQEVNIIDDNKEINECIEYNKNDESAENDERDMKTEHINDEQEKSEETEVIKLENDEEIEKEQICETINKESELNETKTKINEKVFKESGENEIKTNKVFKENKNKAIFEENTLIEDKENNVNEGINKMNENKENHEVNENDEKDETIDIRERNLTSIFIGDSEKEEETQEAIKIESKEVITEKPIYTTIPPDSGERSRTINDNEDNNEETKETMKVENSQEEAIEGMIERRETRKLMKFLDEHCDNEYISWIFDRIFNESISFYLEMCEEGISINNIVSHHKYGAYLIYNGVPNQYNEEYDTIMKEAEEHLKISIEGGYLISYFSLSRLYHDIYKKYSEAFQYASEGSDKGEKNCQFLVGYFMTRGIGHHRDFIGGIENMILSGNEELIEPFSTDVGLYYASKVKQRTTNKNISFKIPFQYEEPIENKEKEEREEEERKTRIDNQEVKEKNVRRENEEEVNDTIKDESEEKGAEHLNGLRKHTNITRREHRSTILESALCK